MSKKVTRAVKEIKETPLSDGTFVRELTISSLSLSDGIVVDIEETYKFPPDRMSILVDDGTLYDWYGREVKIDENIQRIMQPFGTYTNGCMIDEAHETFIVELKNHRFSIAGLKRQNDKTAEIPYFKSLMTGNMLDHASKLTPSRHSYAREGAEIVEAPVFQAYLQNSEDYQKKEVIHVFCDVQDGRITPEYRKSMVVFREERGFALGSWRYHVFAESRERLMSDEDAKKENHAYANYLIGDIVLSEDGRKMSAYAHLQKEDGTYQRVSTDVEFINRIGKNHSLFWYYDD